MATPHAASTVNRPIARITVAATQEYLPAVLAFLREASARAGLGPADVAALEHTVDEVAHNVIVHGFPGGHDDTFDVVLERRPGQIVVAVEDRGLPFDWSGLEAAAKSRPARLEQAGRVDEVHFTNLGRGGNRVESVKRLPFKHIDAYPGSEAPPAVQPLPPPASNQPVTLRLMTADDAIAVARCTYAAYGYDLPDAFLYIPDQVKEMVVGGFVE